MPCTVKNYSTFFSTFLKREEKKRQEQHKREFSFLPRWKRAKMEQSSESISGRMVLEKITQTLERINNIPHPSDPKTGKWKMSEAQDEYSREFIIAMLPVVYSPSELLEDLPYLMKRYGFKKFYSIILLITNRRFGKTYLVSIMASVFGYSIPHGNVVIYAPVKRSSERVLALMNEVLTDLNGGVKGIIEKFNETEVMRIRNAWGNISEVNVYPGTSQGRWRKKNVFFLLSRCRKERERERERERENLDRR